MAIIVLAVVVILFGNLRGKRSVAPAEQSGIACFKMLVAHQLKNCWLRGQAFWGVRTHSRTLINGNYFLNNCVEFIGVTLVNKII